MKCIAYSAEHQKLWDEWVASCRTPLFMFKRGFMEYHADRFQDASVMFFDEDKLVAVFPASRHQDEVISHGGLTFGGMLYSAKVRADTVVASFQVLLEHLRVQGCTKLLYKAIPHIFADQGAQEDLFALTLCGASLARRDLSSVIHLGSRPKLSKGRKWLIARAAKFGLRGTVSHEWEAFHGLLSEALERHGAKPVHSAAELKLLHERFPEHIVLKCVIREGRMLAGALLFRFGQVVHTQYLATNEEGKELGALDALIEGCIQESEARGEKFFSFGISTEQGGKILNSGLINQKENFGARGMVLDFYEVVLK